MKLSEIITIKINNTKNIAYLSMLLTKTFLFDFQMKTI